MHKQCNQIQPNISEEFRWKNDTSNLWIWYLKYLSPLYFHHRYLIRCIDKPRIKSYDYVVRATRERADLWELTKIQKSIHKLLGFYQNNPKIPRNYSSITSVYSGYFESWGVLSSIAKWVWGVIFNSSRWGK